MIKRVEEVYKAMKWEYIRPPFLPPKDIECESGHNTVTDGRRHKSTDTVSSSAVNLAAAKRRSSVDNANLSSSFSGMDIVPITESEVITK
jgi:hypothetical protein